MRGKRMPKIWMIEITLSAEIQISRLIKFWIFLSPELRPFCHQQAYCDFYYSPLSKVVYHYFSFLGSCRGFSKNLKNGFPLLCSFARDRLFFFLLIFFLIVQCNDQPLENYFGNQSMTFSCRPEMKTPYFILKSNVQFFSLLLGSLMKKEIFFT